MRLIETLPLGNRCSVHLVRLGKREILIGVDGAGIKTVAPLAGFFEDALESEVGDQRSEVRGQRSEIENQESGSTDQKAA
jgi:flagellar biogenesis protein FliO